MDAGYAGIETSISAELCVQNAILEARWVFQIDIELTIQAAVSDCNPRTYGCNERVEDKSKAKGGYQWYSSLIWRDERFTVGRDERPNTALRAASPSIRNGVDIDLCRVWAYSTACGSDGGSKGRIGW